MNQPGFWKRQISGEPSGPQLGTDVLLGILLPLVCLILDPVVFVKGGRLLSDYRWFAYAFIGLEIACLTLRLLRRRQPGTKGVAAALFAGSLFSLALGLRMLPLTLAGMSLMFGVAVLGFSPFLTAFVYFRNAVRAWSQGRRPLHGS